MERKDIDRFWNHVNIGLDGDCWEWTGKLRNKKKNSYGAFKMSGKVYSSHRISYVITYGEIPQNMFILHKCNNKKCVNPNHLYAGTQKDNVRDAINDGVFHFARGNESTQFKAGNEHYAHKLSNEDVLEIRRLNKAGIGYRKLGVMFGVDSTNIRCIVKRQTWKHI